MYKKFFKRSKKTVKLRGKGAKGKRLQSIRQTFKQSLCTGLNMKSAVQLPKGHDRDDWIAMNAIELYNTLNLVHDFISEYCTAASCPEMSAGGSHVYYWMDGKEFKRPTECTAAEYVTYLKKWINTQFEDPTVFPQGEGDPFTKKFHHTIKKILARMFRVYAHIYYNHYDKIKALQAEAHLYTCFKHYYYFVSEFKLVDKKEMVPLQSLIDKITAADSAAEEGGGAGATGDSASPAPASAGASSPSSSSSSKKSRKTKKHSSAEETGSESESGRRRTKGKGRSTKSSSTTSSHKSSSSSSSSRKKGSGSSGGRKKASKKSSSSSKDRS